MRDEFLVDIIHWYNRNGDCPGMEYGVWVVVQMFFYLLYFYGCEMQGVDSTKCMATEKWVCILLLISSLFSYRAYLRDRESFWLYSSVLMLMEEL